MLLSKPKPPLRDACGVVPGGLVAAVADSQACLLHDGLEVALNRGRRRPPPVWAITYSDLQRGAQHLPMDQCART